MTGLCCTQYGGGGGLCGNVPRGIAPRLQYASLSRQLPSSNTTAHRLSRHRDLSPQWGLSHGIRDDFIAHGPIP